MLKTVLQQN